jgi:glycosyltransferase involved in cell wall biosynthesis
MKIGIDIRVLMDEYYSGVSEYALNLIKAILEIDKDNDYFFFYNSAGDMSGRIPSINGFKGGVSLRYPNKIFGLLLQKTFKFPKIDKITDVDLFFMPHINFISLSKDSKKVITIHDLSFLRYPEFFSRRKNLWHKLINVKKMLPEFDRVVAVSKSTKNDIMELCGISDEKIEVIYSGIGEEFCVNNEDGYVIRKKNEIRNKYQISGKFILSLCNLEPRKNIPGIIEAYDILRKNHPSRKDYKLVIAGARAWKSEKIVNARDSSVFKDDIQFIGYIKREEKSFLYNMASLFVYPSFYEGFGFPPLEAYYCGTKVIAGNNSSLPEIASDKAIFVNPFNATEIMLAMNEALNSLEEIPRENTEFKWNSAAFEYKNLFEKIK